MMTAPTVNARKASATATRWGLPHARAPRNRRVDPREIISAPMTESHGIQTRSSPRAETNNPARVRRHHVLVGPDPYQLAGPTGGAGGRPTGGTRPIAMPQRGQYPRLPSIRDAHRGQITNGGGPPCTPCDTALGGKGLLRRVAVRPSRRSSPSHCRRQGTGSRAPVPRLAGASRGGASRGCAPRNSRWGGRARPPRRER